MEEPLWIDLETLLLLHEQQLERFGGTAGVLDPGFARSQGFADGNKRIAVASALVFLHVNSHPLHVRPEELYQLTMAVSDERVRLSEMEAANWFRDRLKI